MSGASQAVQPMRVDLAPPATLIPYSVEDLTSGWLEAILRRKHGDFYSIGAHDSYGLKGNQIAACSDLRCFTARGHVRGHEVIDHVIVKLLPVNELMRRVVIDHRMSHCETMVYKELLPALRAFERRHGSKDVQEMTVPCLYAEVLDEPDCAIVLENVQKRGYWTTDSLQLQKPQLNVAVRSLARLAATSHVWLEETGISDLSYLLKNSISDGDQLISFISLGIVKVSERLEQLQQRQLLTKLTNLQRVSIRLLNAFLQRRPAFRVLCHGDFRDGNLLLRETPDGDWQLRAVDWQASRLGGPALDLLYLLLFSLPRRLMAEVEADVLAAYRHHFNQKLAELGCARRYSADQLRLDFTAAKLVGLVWCLSAVQFWERVPGWVEHTVDLAIEVDTLGLLDDLA
ncbi:uncharacterized protein LOC119095648 [Pollicipes pollicipes]|uniref:uncharacterized protein LOC119095648 n=1 Tax=Pollicipes pollicipes TaxID=41117 RepID=UPI00188560DC|nr:uncharacterized protein LOC119095648 [Pollicipes pollicipes]